RCACRGAPAGSTRPRRPPLGDQPWGEAGPRRRARRRLRPATGRAVARPSPPPRPRDLAEGGRLRLAGGATRAPSRAVAPPRPPPRRVPVSARGTGHAAADNDPPPGAGRAVAELPRVGGTVRAAAAAGDLPVPHSDARRLRDDPPRGPLRWDRGAHHAV